MNLREQGWASLKHGGLLISPGKIAEYFGEDLQALSYSQTEQLRRALTAFDGTSQSFAPLMDHILEKLTGLSSEQWQKGPNVESRWAVHSFTGVQIKPRRIWLGPKGETLPVFVPEDGASRQFNSRLGVGRSRQLLSRVTEWLRRTGRPIAVVGNGRHWRLVHVGADYEAWCEWDIDLWFEEGQPAAQVIAWRSLLGHEALANNESNQNRLVTALLESRKGQAELSAVLGERVRQAVEELITASQGAIEQAQREQTAPSFDAIYVAGCRIVMRCIIGFFAEARQLLPIDNAIYQNSYSLEGLRQQLDRRAGGRGNERLAQGRSAWPRLIGLFNLIHQGSPHEAIPVPQYGGALFAPGDANSSDPISQALALLEGPHNTVSDQQVRKLLRLLTRTKAKIPQGSRSMLVDAPVDFSALSSEYIGILYEGLLDFELKQVPADNPVVILNIGNQPALGLAQLEAMDAKDIENLFESLKPKKKKNDESGDGDSTDDVADDDDNAEDEQEEVDELVEVVDLSEDEEQNVDDALQQRVQVWLEHAAVTAKLVKKPKGKKAAQEQAAALAMAAKQLCARLITPGEFYLVRWGGTRKGAGTFYTRPQLAAPTVRRTLQPLAFNAVKTDINERTGLEEVVEWQPKPPQEILALKVCDPAMGSGSFLAGALRYLTDALVQSLFHHGLIAKQQDGGVPAMADGRVAELLSDELLKLNPAHENFEEALRAQLKRHVVERCLYGVDLDPLAVELGRMALWVETMDRDLPFGFLDHKLKVGNALVGTWFDTYRDYPAMAWNREGGDKDYQKDKPANLINHKYTDAKGKLKGDKFTAAIKERGKAVPEQLSAQLAGQRRFGEELNSQDIHDELLAVFEKLHRLPVHESDQRAELYQNQILNNPKYHQLKARMDVWCALWFWPGEQIELAPLPNDFAKPEDNVLAVASELAKQQKFFHWELEFPDVFTEQHKGFDAVLGNPPWEIQKPNSKEFFSNHDPLYRAYGKQEALAKQLEYFGAFAELEHRWIAYNGGLKAMSNWAKFVGVPFGDRITEDAKGKQKYDLNLGGGGKNSFANATHLHQKWQQQRAQRSGYADAAHPFLHQGSADLNTYKLFLEQSHAILHNQGRLGMIVPSGIYTDKGTTQLRELFLDYCDWQWLFGFENRDKVFDIDSRFKFCPLIIQKGSQTKAIRAAFMHRNVDDWDNADRYVLAYPRERVLEFSPWSKAILEIRSEQDLKVLQKIYANGVLLGDQSEKGWGIKYATEFHMTNDSKLFPPRPKWEEQGYVPDEYGHWLKGGWQDYAGPAHILDREKDLVLSRDGLRAIKVVDIEDVALPLYEGRMIGQFDFSEKGWVSGKGRTAVWRDISFADKVIEPQYLAGASDVYDSPKTYSHPKISYMRIGSATNARTAISTVLTNTPAGDSVFFYRSKDGSPLTALAVSSNLNCFAYDFHLRNRVGGLNLSEFIMDETAVISPEKIQQSPRALNIISSLTLISEATSILSQSLFNSAPSEFHEIQSKTAWKQSWALTHTERLRLKAIFDALYAALYGLSLDEFTYILRDCDTAIDAFPKQMKLGTLDPKGFWRIDKDKDPELRHTVLSLVAFHDLQEKGLDTFLAQNDGEGWMLPETLRLADYGLGHDDRAKEYQPVAARLGPRFYDWQLNEDVERSWQECVAHAELIRKIVPLPETKEAEAAENLTLEPALNKPQQGALF